MLVARSSSRRGDPIEVGAFAKLYKKAKPPNLATCPFIGDFKDKVYPLFESDTFCLKCFVCIVFSYLVILRIEGSLNSTL